MNPELYEAFEALEEDQLREKIFTEISNERDNQVAQWGVQSHPMIPQGTEKLLRSIYGDNAQEYKSLWTEMKSYGVVTWDTTLLEEVYEALAEEDLTKMRAELIQVAAVIVAMVEDIDTRE